MVMAVLLHVVRAFSGVSYGVAEMATFRSIFILISV